MDQFMGLQAEPPLRVCQDIADDLVRILSGAGLQEVVLGRKGGIGGQGLSDIDHLHLVDMGQDDRCALFG